MKFKNIILCTLILFGTNFENQVTCFKFPNIFEGIESAFNNFADRFRRPEERVIPIEVNSRFHHRSYRNRHPSPYCFYHPLIYNHPILDRRPSPYYNYSVPQTNRRPRPNWFLHPPPSPYNYTPRPQSRRRSSPYSFHHPSNHNHPVLDTYPLPCRPQSHGHPVPARRPSQYYPHQPIPDRRPSPYSYPVPVIQTPSYSRPVAVPDRRPAPYSSQTSREDHKTFNRKNTMPTGNIIDSAPEQNKPLSAKYKKSFAYPTFKTRAPKILDGVIGLLKTEDNKPQEAVDESKVIIRQIEELKLQMQNDKPLTEIQPPEGVLIDEDLSVYNNMLSERKQRGQFPTWFETEWLFAECYMYRRLNQIFENSNSFQKFDPFMPEKVKTLIASKEPIIVTAKILRELKDQTLNLTEEKRKEMFIFFLKCSLWGNKADLSLSGGSAVAAECMTADDESTILVNDTLAGYEALKSSSENVVVDIILDNAGYELYNDLCFADYLIWSGLAHTVNFHGKLIPWFVSDVTHQDFDMIFTLLKSNFEYEYLSQLVDQWQKYINAGSWTMKCDKFWVLPYDYSQMKKKDVELHDKLADSQLLIFKGDLNYRKLVGDIAWEPTTPFEKALRGFRPTNLVALRTVKADTICGLKPGQAESITKIHPNWMITGDYAVIQFLKKN